MSIHEHFHPYLVSATYDSWCINVIDSYLPPQEQLEIVINTANSSSIYLVCE